jgi:hypothetical protein
MSGRRRFLVAALLVAFAAFSVAVSSFPTGEVAPADAMLQDAGSSTEAGVYYTTAEAGSAAEPAAIADLEDGAARNAASSHDTVAADGNACVEAAPCTGDELRILVSIEQRMLWLVDGQDTLLSAPVAIGMGKGFTWGDREYHFETPRGTRKVLAKAKDPVWIVPEWHYYEKAAKLSLDSVVRLERGDRIQLSDSSYRSDASTTSTSSHRSRRAPRSFSTASCTSRRRARRSGGYPMRWVRTSSTRAMAT